MAIGFFSKLFDIVKKVGSGIVHGIQKAREIGSKVLLKAMPVVEKIPIIGSVAKVMEPAIKYSADHKGKTVIPVPIEKLFNH